MEEILDDKNWFEAWFDTPYYHLLYKNRNFKEAGFFINNLIDYLVPPKEASLLDACCGKGRHALYMNQLGFSVDAFDLSANNIKHAKQYENNKLHFFENDIRQPLNEQKYNIVFNLFTSFGYFDDEADNIQAIKALSDSLKQDGVLVIDFLNAQKAIETMASKEEKKVDDLTFKIKRKVKDGFIVKQISFEDNGRKFSFEEKVKALYQKDFINYFNLAGLKLIKVAGDYQLNDFDIHTSDRLILFAKK